MKQMIEGNNQLVRVILIGDSTVWGSCPRALAPDADQLEDVVRKLLACEPDLPPTVVVNKGKDNETVQRLLAERYDRDIGGEQPADFIFIRYGINDREYLPDFAVQFPETYRELIMRLRRDHPAAFITLETIIPYRDEASTREVNALIRSIAEVEKLPVLDTHARFAEALKAGPHMLYYRRIDLSAVPPRCRALIPESAILDQTTVCALDNTLDAHLEGVPGWFDDRHPNLAGYHVIGEGLAGYLAPLIRGL